MGLVNYIKGNNLTISYPRPRLSTFPSFVRSSVFLQKQLSNKFGFTKNKSTAMEMDSDADSWENFYNEEFATPSAASNSLLLNSRLEDNSKNGTTVMQNGTFLKLLNSLEIDSGNENGSDAILLNPNWPPNSSTVNLRNLTEILENDFVNKTGKFDASEYAVFASVLLISAVVGVFYGCFGKNHKSTDEYLMASRQMATVPAALSLLCSFISAITILGNPVEIYLYGSTYGLIIFSFVPMTIALSYFYVPVFFNLKLKSAYEYFELRFDFRLRTVVSLIAIFHYIMYMALCVMAPALAIGQVTGINIRMSTSVIFIVCIFYSTLGGLKGVVATDAFQAVVMIGTLITVVWQGTQELGGPQTVWNVANQFERTNFLNFDFDPRTRHTVWTSIIGGYLQWLPHFAATHSQVQRYLSMPTLNSIRRALLLNLLGFILIFGLCYWCGLLIFAKYHDCDPLFQGRVTRMDQLLPFFVMESMGSYPGIPGLFVAGLTCASLSSVSTGLNALSAIVTYDYLKHWMPGATDASLLIFSRGFCLIFGAISFGSIFIAENFENILPAAMSVASVAVGPTLGAFTLGMLFPYSNSKGSLLGLLSAFFVMTTVVIGSHLAIQEDLIPSQILPGISTLSCDAYQNSSHVQLEELFLLFDNQTERGGPTFLRQIGPLEDLANEVFLNLFSISYMWHPALGCTISILFGLFFSSIVACCDKSKRTNPNHLSPPVLWVFCKLFPVHSLKWIDIDDDDEFNGGLNSLRSSTHATLSIQSKIFSYQKDDACELKLNRLSSKILDPTVESLPQSYTSEEWTSNTNTTDSLA